MLLRKLNQMMVHSGKAWQAQTIFDLVEGIVATRKSDQENLRRTRSYLKTMQQFEQGNAEKIASRICDEFQKNKKKVKKGML